MRENCISGSEGGGTRNLTGSSYPINPSVRALHRRLKENGKPDKVARIADARKLLLIAHVIYQSGETFHVPSEKGG